MEAKKNPKVDVRRNSAIYFAVSLVLTLFLANYFINYKTYNNETIDMDKIAMADLDEEDIPITEHLKTPPPQKKPPVVPEIIEEIDDEEDIKESIIESTESYEDDEIIDVEDVHVDEVSEDIVVPFIAIEHVPTFPGCEKGNNEQKRKCMSTKITKLVQKKFNTSLAEELGLSGRQRIYVTFKIDKTGEIVGVQSRAPHIRLQKEAERVINLLPKMKPGQQRGEAVVVSYSLPIIFQVQN